MFPMPLTIVGAADASKAGRSSKSNAKPYQTKVDPEIEEQREKALLVTERLLQRQCYYHGFISLQDAKTMLQQPGDFLVRSTKLPPSQVQQAVQRAKLELVKRKRKDNNTWPTLIAGPNGIRHNIVVLLQSGESVDIPVQTTGVMYKELMFFTDECLFAAKTIPQFILNHIQFQFQLEQVHHARIMRPVKLHPWEIHQFNLEITKVLGSGSYGSVYLAMWTKKGGKKVKVALKTAIEDPYAKTGQKGALQEMLHEASLLRRFDHPNIVRFYGVAALQYPVYMVLECVSGGSLDSYLEKTRTKKEQDPEFVGTTQRMRVLYCLQAARGIEYIHYLGALHRDIAGRNCLIDVDNPGDGHVVKISDLGLTRTSEEYQMQVKRDLPLRWTSPETLKSYKWNRKSDVYSFAVLMWEIYTDGGIPYHNMKGYEVAKFVPKGGRPMHPDLIYENMQRVIDMCWHRNADARPEMVNLVQMLQIMLAETPVDMADPPIVEEVEQEE